MIPRFHLRPAAKRDLAAIHVWYGEYADLPTAHRFLVAATHTVMDIVAHPRAARSRSAATAGAPGLRSRTIGGFRAYLVFYTLTENEVEIVRILHGARDVDRVLRDDDGADSVHETPILAGALYTTPVETAWRAAC